MYICGRCGNNETTLESIQMRSLDEGNSIFATCVDCGKKWQVA
jgi:DNA-directed RNA polymerase subunit M/transcription elongation factor TFIIS